MINRNLILSLLVCSLILAPILFFPLSNDLSIFYHAAKTILSGGKLYVDFIDIKPPLGYILFIPIILFSGHSEFMLRFADFIIQLTILILLFRLIQKKTSNDIIPFVACIFYSLSYVAFNFNQTMQLESFMGLIVLLLIKIQVSDNKKTYIWLLRGFLLALLISIKFTSIIVYLVLIIDDFFTEKNSKPFIKQVLTLISFLIAIILIHIILLDLEIYNGFSNALKYLMIYGSQPPINFEYLKFSLKQISEFFADNLSLSLTILFLIGIIYNLKNQGKHIYNFSILIFIFLFASIILERKYFEYHFLRFYIPLSIVASYGLVTFFTEIKSFNTYKNIQAKFISIAILIFFLLFSPLPRWIQTWIPTYYYFVSKEKYNQYYERKWTSAVLRKSSLDVASFINQRTEKNDKVLVISNINNQLNFFIEKGVKSRFALSCFYLSNFNIEHFEKLFFDELKNANWLIVQTNDGNLYAMGHLFSSYDALLQNKHFSHLLIENFQEVKDFKFFKVFSRK
ncbi:MAG: glycosyltransferase family 39 protein [Candidatus Kapabacteria bacterium]|nr:glycosyltransferase family 39 protein [Candidatus Kapabacteria bacterium]